MTTNDVKTIIEEMLGHLRISFEGVSVTDDFLRGTAKIAVVSGESHLLIGAHGSTLLAINHLAKRIAEKKARESGKEPPGFFVDVNDYQSRTIENLKTKAKMLSERARAFKSNVELPPMSPYERMLIHTYLEGMEDLRTESEGEGKDRRVIIKYIAS